MPVEDAAAVPEDNAAQHFVARLGPSSVARALRARCSAAVGLIILSEVAESSP